MREHPARVLGERQEQPVLGRREVHRFAAHRHHPPGPVDREFAGGEDRLLRAGRAAGRVAQRHAHARQQFRHAERLGEVVVGAGVERVDLVALLSARREHDDRPGVPLPEPARHLDAVGVRESEIEQDEVRVPAGGLGQAVAGGGRLDQPVRFGRQRRAQETPHRQFVLDEQHDRTRIGHGAATSSSGSCSSVGGTPTIGRVKRNAAPPPAR